MTTSVQEGASSGLLESLNEVLMALKVTDVTMEILNSKLILGSLFHLGCGFDHLGFASCSSC